MVNIVLLLVVIIFLLKFTNIYKLEHRASELCNIDLFVFEPIQNKNPIFD